MKIKGKILVSILGTCLLSLIISVVIGLISLSIMKDDLIENQENSSNDIHKTTVESVEQYAKNFAVITNESFKKNVESRLKEISSDVLAVKLSLEELYKNNISLNGHFEGNNVFVASGVGFNNIKSEYEKIKIIERTIENILAKPSAKIPVFYASESGFMLSNQNFDFSSSANIDRRKRDWYKGAKEKKDIFWTDTYNDSITGEPMVTCSAPVYENGKLMGVVEEDIEVLKISTEILEQDSSVIGYSFLTDKIGNVIIGSEKDKNLSDVIDKESENEILNKMKDSDYSSDSIVKENLIVGFSHIKDVGWGLAVLLDYQKIIEPANIIKSSINEANKKNKDVVNGQILKQLFLNSLSLLVIGLISLLISKKISDSLTKPIKMLEDGVRIISSGDLDNKITIKSRDEIGLLAKSFNEMADRIKNLIEEVAIVAAKEQKIGAELNIAKTIQSSMLPYVFPAFPDRKEIDIYASMTPAKQVGGDFYDFFFIDENNIAFVIADVSGKGVPAALFMVIAKTLIKDRAQAGLAPAEVLDKVNKRLCENNVAEMFLTCFFAILNLKTGKLSFSNAGHNFPLIYKKNEDKYEWLNTKPKFVLAAFPQMKYSNEEIQIFKGDVLFFYTDGVTEALNPKKELYSDQKLIDELNNKTRGKTPKEIIEKASESIKDFVKDAEQSDDITMLSFLFSKSNNVKNFSEKENPERKVE